MGVDVLVGLQWGDEGKGKIVDLIANKYDVVARFQGGPNAGHTLIVEGKKYVLHTIPSGIIHANTINVVGAGTVIDPTVLVKELEMLHSAGISTENRLIISDKAHLILPTHKLLDEYYEKQKGEAKIGSTLRGIGPAYQDKYARTGLRMHHIHSGSFKSDYEALKKLHLVLLSSLGYEQNEEFKGIEEAWLNAIDQIRNIECSAIENYLNNLLDKGGNVLAEGAQGTLLDISFGSYPFVTSSNTSSASACIGLGVAPQRIKKVIGVYKAYLTRVGSGPFPTELDNEIGRTLMTFGNEYGATTGRERRCGWLDLPLLKQTVVQNGVTDLVITKSDVLTCLETFKAMDVSGKLQEFNSWEENISSVRDYSHLPQNLKLYLGFIESELALKNTMISTGPGRDEIIMC
ncbi:MAG: adenylosuccinate synthase [Bacteroidetes bacterium]|nr:adenylosuccinate synthase [Bacteroidota bacterium]